LRRNFIIDIALTGRACTVNRSRRQRAARR
jgi:hypothetical protein